MTLKEHKKHAALARPSGGLFHRNELAFIGAPCSIIQALAGDVADRLTDFSLGYADADHGSGEERADAFSARYTDKISWHQLDWNDARPDYGFWRLFQQVDAVLVNGNHFKAAQQVVIVHPGKEDSLKRKLDRLTNVTLVLLAGPEKPFGFLDDHVAGVPILRIEQTKEISEAVASLITDQTPVIRGLVLAGGESLRMGTDKGGIAYHGRPQREHAASMLTEFCEQVFISARKEQEIDSEFEILPDTFMGLGPYGGILSAFRMDPNAAWLVTACDLPLLDRRHLARLVDNRNVSATATCFHNPATGFPEPLITLWEPRAYPALLEFLAMGYSCPRKVLINSNSHQITAPDDDGLTNVNTPDEQAAVKARLNG